MKNIIFNDGNIFNKSLVSKAPNLIFVPHSKMQKDAACLPNAVEIARHNSGVSIIEGLVIVIPSNPETEEGGIIKHAWNIRENIQFDLTEELIWELNYKELLYYPIFLKNENEYGQNLVDFDPQIYMYKEELENQLETAKQARLKDDFDIEN